MFRIYSWLYFYNRKGEDMGEPVQLTDEERDCVLAALRLWQTYTRRPEAHDTYHGLLHEIATNDEQHRPLTNEEIEQLCRKLVACSKV